MPRETGYRIRIDVFVKTDPADIDLLGKVYHAIKKARDDSEVGAVLDLGTIEDVTFKSTSRNAPAPKTPPPVEKAEEPTPAPAAPAERAPKAKAVAA